MINQKHIYIWATVICVFMSQNAIADNEINKWEKKFKVDAKAGKLSFLAADGTVAKEYPLDKLIPSKRSASLVTFSDNGKFVCVSSGVNPSSAEDDKASDEVFVVFDDAGNKIWSNIDFFRGYAVVSPNGKYVVSEEGEDNTLQIYYPNGKRIDLKSDEGLDMAFSHDGSFVVIETVRSNPIENKLIHEKTGMWGGGDETDLNAISDSGQVLWKKSDFIKGRNFAINLKPLGNNNIEVDLFEIKNKTNHFWIYNPDGICVKTDSLEGE